MASFKTSTTEITIQNPRFPSVKGSRSLILRHNLRDGRWVAGSITGTTTHITRMSPRFMLLDSEFDLLFDFIENSIYSGLHKCLYWDGRTEGAEGSYKVTYLGGLENANRVQKDRNEVTLLLEGTYQTTRII